MRTKLFLAAFLLAPSTLADPTKAECVEADTRAQTLRGQGKLREASTQLDICIAASCPVVVRQDCTERLDEVNRVMPSVVFDIKDSSGADLVATKITMDGQPLTDGLTGKAVPIDPGEHTFVFSIQGHVPRTMHFVIHEGDKERRLNVVVGAVAAEEPSTTPPPTNEPSHTETEPEAEKPASSSPGTAQRVAGIVTGALGLVGVGMGVGFGAAASSSWNASKSECSSGNCPTQALHDQAVIDHDNAVTFATVSTVGFVAGGILAAAGIVLFLAAPHAHSTDQPSTGLRITPLLGLGSGGVMLSGVFR